MGTYTIILSAGKGKRMKSLKPKVLQEILGKSMINIVMGELASLDVLQNYVVVGYKQEMIKEELNGKFSNVEFVTQEEQLGTGHAVAILSEQMKDLEGTTIITCGDIPLVTTEIFENFLKYHKESSHDLTVLSTEVDDPFGYGRIIRDESLEVSKIVEQKDATEIEQKNNEINSGIYCVDNKKLFDNISGLNNNNAQGEYYLTDIVSVFKDKGLKVGAYKVENSQSLEGVNDISALIKANEIMKQRINNNHLNNGVKILDPSNTYIGVDVEICPGTIIYPGNHIMGKVKIGENNILHPNNYIEDAEIGSNNNIGPMCHIRQNTKIYDNTRVGNFVELKNSTLNNGVKAAHLTYIGDTEVGENTNIGCGVITANYDGKNKFKIKIGSNSFIGSNVNLIAPIEISDDSFIAAGTTVTKDIPKNKFVIGRSKEIIKDRK